MPQHLHLQRILKPQRLLHAAEKAWRIAKPAAQAMIRRSAEAERNPAAKKLPAAAAKAKAEQADARTRQAQPREQLLIKQLPLKSNQGNLIKVRLEFLTI
jgi:hypothetical protein